MTTSAYNAIIKPLNQCDLMGIEKVIKSVVIATNRITITIDNFKQYRITLKDIESGVIVSAILFDQFRTIRFKYTLECARGNNYTKQLLAYIHLVVKRKFYHSDNLTIAGAYSVKA